jgi:UDPglucose 6-dehydrogenase
MKGRTIGLLGLAFKPDTDDLRDAPSLQIAERLHELGARVKVYDPIAMEPCKALHPSLKVRYCDSAEEVAADADALVVVTEWDQFRRLNLAKMAATMNNRILIDGRNLFHPEDVLVAGFDYDSIGRSTRTPMTLFK